MKLTITAAEAAAYLEARRLIDEVQRGPEAAGGADHPSLSPPSAMTSPVAC